MLTAAQPAWPADFAEFSADAIHQAIHQRLEYQARIHTHHVALRGRDATCTYGELNGFANSIADHILSACGSGLGQAAILLPNTSEMVLALEAALKAHKAYVPLDPHFPQERLRTMFEDSEPMILLTNSRHRPLAEDLAGSRVPILDISTISRHADAPNPQVPCDPLDRAYILYTSGTTGRPKGIAFLHRNLLHTTRCLTNQLCFSPSDNITWLHSASFAASVVDLYCALLNGATLYPWDSKSRGFTGLADWLTSERVTTLQWIPSAFRQFLRTVSADFVFPDMRLVVMASEPLTMREFELFRRHFPPACCLVNQVGTSESYNYRLYTLGHDSRLAGSSVPAGYAVSPDREVLILDADRHPLPAGATGEIGVRSDYMSAGYWRDDELTARKFVRIGGDPRPVYLTGDLGRLEPDGCLMHLGRQDSQVKIRGYRVQLAEIEHVLDAAPGIADSAASVVKNRFGEDQLIGYVVLDGAASFHQAEIEIYLESRLPDYMVPHQFVVLDSLPALPNGKIDRRGLPHPREPEVRGLFGELLRLSTVAPDLDFLASGADSLLVAVLLQRIYQRFGVEIPIDDFLTSPTPRDLAHRIGGPAAQTLVRESDSSPPALPPALTNVSNTRAVTVASGSPRNLIIVSAGKLGREAYAWASQAIAAGAALKIKGFLDDRSSALANYTYDAPILGDVDHYAIQEGDVFLGAIGTPADKPRYYRPLLDRGGRFISLIHPLANLGRNVRLGTGVLLAPYCSITCDAAVGDHVSVGAFSNLGHDTVVGDWCQISSHCGLNGNVHVAEGVFLGSHACLIPEVRIAAWAYVGAGSVVVRDVAPGVKVFGNPAMPVGKTEGPPRMAEEAQACRR